MKRIVTLLVLVALFSQAEAREIRNYKVAPNNNINNTGNRLNALAGACEPASQGADLDINNVRTRILNGGDMWWDLNTARYEIPKVNDANAIRKNSLFAGALWIGGLEDGSNNLKLAAMTYRQRGSDFWPGPLDVNTSTTEAARCEAYDRIWEITREELQDAEESGWTNLTSNILEWPGGINRGASGISSANESSSMAPYFERPGSGTPGVYEPALGEYPALYPDKNAASNTPADQPDQMLWYVYNDNGNIHSETGGIPIGLELQLQSFAFATNDEVNNMTFYRSTIINRGQTEIKETYMGQWVDPDLGNFVDDYVGCDVGRSLGICYNGDDNDEGVLGYGLNPPTIGIDYFEGPLDENGDELGLSHFMYFNNDANPISGNPQIAIDFYNYLQGKWRNGQTVRWGDRNGSGGSVETPWMWPFDTILPGQSLWTERTAGNTPNDRRFVQSSGPFTLKPGVVNYITIGAVWARATSGGALGSLELLRKASDRAQKLFNNQFDLVDGPEAPDVEIQELENELVLTFLNTNSDKVENYVDTVISETGSNLEYKFQGYMVYQLADPTVGTGDLDNIDKARLVFQCDIEDEFDQIINQEFDAIVSADIPVEKVDGANEGLVNTISIKEDVFSAAADKSLINFRTYYFLVLSYATITNDPLKSDPNQFLAGRSNIQVYSAIPHKNEPEKTGIKLNAEYGSGPRIKTISGTGNGGNVLEFTPETVEAILANGSVDQPVYMGGNGPVNISITDPVKVPVADFRLEILDTFPTVNNNSEDSIRSNSTYWKLTNLTSSEVVYSDRFLKDIYESVQGLNDIPGQGETKPSPNLHDWGMAVTINQVLATANDSTDGTQGLLSWDVVWEDQGRQWLTGLVDNDGSIINNWIRAGQTHTVGGGAWSSDPYVDDFWYAPRKTRPIDGTEAFEKVWNGRIAPYTLASRAGLNAGRNTFGPALSTSPTSGNAAIDQMNNVASVDLVITPDKSKWTKCVVIETGDNENRDQHIGRAEKFDIRKSPSVDRNGNPIGGEEGRGWFPGYAINLETGERLNIIFGEDSYMTGANGTDMIWNPTSQMFTGSSTYPIWGGKHWVYIMSSNNVGNAQAEPYDEGAGILRRFNDASSSFIGRTLMMNTAMWVLPTIMESGFEIGKDGVPPTEVTIKLRMSKPYATRDDDEMPVYEFNTRDIAPLANDETARDALDLVSVVPNPYYAYSEYESSPVDSRIKITNLPSKCTVSIFSTKGTLIRTFNKDDEATFVDWDLKNQDRVPIAGGVYIIHVKTPDGEEKTIKWFGVIRALDLDSF